VHARETRHRRSLCRGSESGAVAVEFALILPILLILVLGIIQYGMYFYARQGGSDVARDAARRAAVGEPSTCAAFRTMVRANINDVTGSGSTATITRTYTKSNPRLVQVGDTVNVTVSFTSFDMNIPLVPMVADGRVAATVKSRVEYVPTQPQECT
jgi:Flp pilus assembly protein TadG